MNVTSADPELCFLGSLGNNLTDQRQESRDSVQPRDSGEPTLSVMPAQLVEVVLISSAAPHVGCMLSGSEY